MARKSKPKNDKRSYGTGNIYPNSNGTFTIQVYLDRKLVRRRAANREAAELVLAELNELKRVGVDLPAGSQSFAALANRWFNEVLKKRDGVKERTVDHHRDIIQRYLIPQLGHMRALDIRPHHIHTVLNRLREHVGAQTVYHTYGTLKQIMAFALGLKMIPDNPAIFVERPKVKRIRKEAPTAAQMRALIAGSEHYRLINSYHIVVTLGLRIGELLGLRWSDVDWEKRTITIRQQINYRTGKAASTKNDEIRLLPLPPRAYARLRDQWERLQLERQDNPAWHEHGYIFPNELGKAQSPRNYARAFTGYDDRKRKRHYVGAIERAGLPLTMVFHDLRRFVATTLEDVGASESVIQHILGHGEKNVTQRYIRTREKMMRVALEALEAELWGEGAEERTG